MQRVLFLLAMLFFLESPAFATWSVIAVDRSTRRVVMAASSCVDTTDDRMKDAIAVVVPGVGIAACQAAADGSGRNQTLVFEELNKGTEPRRIIEMLSADPAFQSRQFAIVDMDGQAAGHSGLSNGFVTQFMYGQVPGTEIFYAVQGNTLRMHDVVPAAVEAFIETDGSLADRAMAALETGDRAGGDSRCTCPPTPADGSEPPIPCDAKTSHVAYILMAEPTDTNGESYNDGDYAMYITVSQPSPDHPQGIRAGEDLNPVKTLRMRYDRWRSSGP